MSGNSGHASSSGVTTEDVEQYHRLLAWVEADAAKDRPADAGKTPTDETPGATT